LDDRTGVFRSNAQRGVDDLAARPWVRRIYMTEEHSEKVNPSWFGESIGRYEKGELVVDTIGLGAHMLSFIDMYRTPHTEKLHVVEHFKVTADNKFLEALVKIEDEDTFNEPMYMTKRWRRDSNVWMETICAENNIDPFNENPVEAPQAQRPDFDGYRHNQDPRREAIQASQARPGSGGCWPAGPLSEEVLSRQRCAVRSQRELTLFVFAPSFGSRERGNDQATLLTPQKNGSGPFAIPVIFLRQA
jgi:hypothetical protein